MADKAKQDAAKSNVTDQTYIDFIEELAELVERKDEAVSAIRNCRQRAKDAGVDMQTLDEKLKEKELDDARRREKIINGERIERLLNMTTTIDLTNAVQAEMDFSAPDPATQERIDRMNVGQEGVAAGRRGDPRDSNKYEPSSLAWSAFDQGWIQGNETRIALEEQKNSQGPGPKRRGRPPGSKNNKKTEAAEAESSPSRWDA